MKQVFNIKLKKTNRSYGIREMYSFFKILHPNEDVPYALFVEVISRYNKLLVKKLLNGDPVSLGHQVGRLRVKRVERKFYTKRIDWGETNKLKKQGINKHVYYTEDFWLRFSWLKGTKLKNKTVYKFTPTKGCHGITTALAKYCKTNPFAYQNFQFNPS